MKHNIEAQLDAITADLQQKLESANAIDQSGKATNIAEFNHILDGMIAACEKVLATTEEGGVTTDKFGANIAYARISWLQDMKDHGSINPHANHEEQFSRQDQEFKSRVDVKPSSFRTGIKNAFAKLKNKFTNTNSNTNGR